MKKLFSCFLALAALVLTMDSCSSYKKIPYFQNIDEVDLSGSRGLYDATIQPKDLLSINVSTVNPDAAKPFNINITDGSMNSSSSEVATTRGYLVDNSGNINFPVIGRLHVAGLTKSQCENLIRQKLSPYMSKTEDPIVTVRMASFRVTVTGEVASPGVIPVTTEKMSVIEALAQAGDLTIYGRRDNILLIRENADGQKSQHRLNLNDAGIINSPYYYLQQNDIVYVSPNKVKARNSSIGTSTTLWFSVIGIITSVASLVVNIVR